MTEVPLSEAFPGITVKPLLEKEIPICAIVIVKTLDADGDDAWVIRHSSDVNDVEVIGAMTMLLDLCRRRAISNWNDDDD